MVADPSTIGGIAESSVISANSPAHSQVIAVVIARKPSVRAVTASTVGVA